jgi:hypothetical protein
MSTDHPRESARRSASSVPKVRKRTLPPHPAQLCTIPMELGDRHVGLRLTLLTCVQPERTSRSSTDHPPMLRMSQSRSPRSIMSAASYVLASIYLTSLPPLLRGSARLTRLRRISATYPTRRQYKIFSRRYITTSGQSAASSVTQVRPNPLKAAPSRGYGGPGRS